MALSPLERTSPTRSRPGLSPGGEAAGRATPGPDGQTGWRFPRRVVLAASLSVLTAVLVAGLLIGDAAPEAAPAGLPDPGPVTGWGLPAAHLAMRLLAVLTVGQLLLAAYLAPVRDRRLSAGAVRALRWSVWTGGGWLLATGTTLLLTASSTFGVPLWQVSAQGLAAVSTQLAYGRASLWVAGLLLVVVLGAWALTRTAPTASTPTRPGLARVGAWVLLVAALGAVTVPGVLAGHSSAADNHVPAVTALSVHVVTASLWVGGLAALLLHTRTPADRVHAVTRFSTLALACLTLLTLSGVAAALLVAGTPTLAWLTQGWVHLLALKTLLLLTLAAAGWAHRRTTIPALATGRPHAFLRLGVAEVALMALTLTVSVALTSSAAPTPGAATPAGPPPTTTAPQDPAAPAPADDPAEDDDADGTAAPTAESGTTTPPATQDDAPLEDMSGHDHGDLSVTVLIDDTRFHVGSTVRPGQPVTVYNSSDTPATLTATDGSFDVDVPARTFITFPAPAEEGDYPFTNRTTDDTTGWTDTLPVRADP